MGKNFIMIGEDEDILCLDNVISITFGDRKKYKNEADVRFWFNGFYLDYIDVSEEEKKKIKELFKTQIVSIISGKRNKAKEVVKK